MSHNEGQVGSIPTKQVNEGLPYAGNPQLTKTPKYNVRTGKGYYRTNGVYSKPRYRQTTDNPTF